MQTQYFQALNEKLKRVGNGQPQLILDLKRFKHNIAHILSQWPQHLTPRLVVKSLANLNLLKLTADEFQTKAFMVFHLAHIRPLYYLIPDADMLLGKPMPISGVTALLKEHSYLATQVHWLIDSVSRLGQYLALAQSQQLQLNINLEIDIGLHRGGFEDLVQFQQALTLIQHHSKYLKLTGLMGYDAHVRKLPKVVFSPIKAFQKSQQRYQEFIQIIEQFFPTIDVSMLCFNGAGSTTLHHHFIQTVCNDLSFGSLLLKPLDFELSVLAQLKPALLIAAPILKVLDHIQVPGLEKFQAVQPKQQGICVYGGYWRGEYVYPKGVQPHVLFGRSTNQEVLNISNDAAVDVDDYVFLRPAQSESILPQFAELYVNDDSDTFKVWENLRE
ncbi:alanine racemase [Acinetobacter sp. NCu2D-2]|uniref:alanine racemase n=1 Tax=Acinetobacter sp. NCu2D-2 TaxID=1608473 RepID=UPI0007CDF45E|nr:alanine racemase [Acinetobacter sp. NCu2D-2]ANF82476.1 alanine racemase [Acinetobacter sp. NCu2D-2]